MHWYFLLLHGLCQCYQGWNLCLSSAHEKDLLGLPSSVLSNSYSAVVIAGNVWETFGMLLLSHGSSHQCFCTAQEASHGAHLCVDPFRQVNSTDGSDQKPESSSLGANLSMSNESK